MQREDDPLEIFRFSADLGHEMNHQVLNTLTDLEVQAVLTARPTAGAAELIKRVHASGKSVAVISNNSVAAVTTYLRNQDLLPVVDHISARAAADPSLMKPNPYLVRQALALLNADGSQSVLVGDSVGDMLAAKASGVGAIGYANRPGKTERLLDAGADAIVTEMTDLLATEPSSTPEARHVVATIVTSHAGVLVVRRNDGKPPWTFIAGEIEPGESPSDAAIREVKEETGLHIRAGEVIGRRVHPRTGRTMVYIAAQPTHGLNAFVGDIEELAEVRWVSLAEADELMGGQIFESVRQHLQRSLSTENGGDLAGRSGLRLSVTRGRDVRVIASSEPGAERPNEDYVAVGQDMIVVLDGATARTETGCIHGVAWYVRHLADAIIGHPDLPPEDALART
jgi:HAD superfamily hydrolase (TIGR01509 family)